MPPVRPLRLRRLLSTIPLSLALAALISIPAPAALAGPSACQANKVTNQVALVYSDVQSAVDAVSAGSTVEVRGICLGPVVIGKNLTLIGRSTTEVPQPGIYGQESVRVLTVQAGATVTVRKLELAYGLVDGPDEDGQGGGVLNHGTLTLTNVIVTENDAIDGGGIANFGTLTLAGATKVHHNRASEFGGGIYTTRGLTLRDTAAVHENTAASRGGGIVARSSTGPLRPLVLHDASVVRKNTSGGDGGGIVADGFKILLDGNASVRGNTAADDGGGVTVGRGSLTLAGHATLRGNGATSGGGFASFESDVPALFLKGSSVVSGNTATRFAAIITYGNITMSGSAAVRDHVGWDIAVIAIGGSPGYRPVFTMKDTSRVTHNTGGAAGSAAVIRGCELLPTFVGLKPRVKNNTPKNIGTVPC